MVNTNKYLEICRIVLLLCLSVSYSDGQRGNVWIFGDSARLEFNQPGTSLRSNSWRSYGSASISDTSGNLICYSTATAYNGIRESGIYNSSNQLLLNGGGIYNLGSFNSNLIIPYPGNDSLFYLFCQDYFPDAPIHPEGIYMNVVNPTRGLSGEVIQKNIQIKSGKINALLTALQHGNGRDWWVYFSFDSLNSGGSAYVLNNKIYRILVTPAGVSPIYSQNIGTLTFLCNTLAFNKQGNKAAICTGSGLIEIFDIDRCTGLFSNPITICPHNQFVPFRDIEFSENSRYLYTISLQADSNCFYQIDLQNTLPCQSKIPLHYYPLNEVPGSVSRWIDDRIYTAQSDITDLFDDTLHTLGNSNLGVVDFPNNLGVACQFNPYGISLNGARVVTWLPNNPDYELRNWSSSVCDSLSTGLGDLDPHKISLTVYPNPAHEAIVIEASEALRGAQQLAIYSTDGRELFSMPISGDFYNQKVEINNLSEGSYIIVLSTTKSSIHSKFTKQ